MSAEDNRFFFVHVMKTGGATFRRHIEHNFPSPGAVYPDRDLDGDMREANFFIQRLLQLPPERRAQIRAYTGHFPFVVPGLLDPQLITLTLLRDPVARTISYLKHCKRYHEQHHDLALEEIYEDSFFFPTLIRDHQVKVFAMTTQDKLESYMDVMEIDDERRQIAESNLELVDVVGVQERHEEFLAEVQRRFGWEILPRRKWRESNEDWDVSDSFRRRIVEENAADVAFFQFARELVEDRSGRRT